MRKYAGLIVAIVVGVPLGIYADVYNAHLIGISLLLVLGASAAMYDCRG
jgi:F0F1-type ATP synthase assembly protein I